MTTFRIRIGPGQETDFLLSCTLSYMGLGSEGVGSSSSLYPLGPTEWWGPPEPCTHPPHQRWSFCMGLNLVPKCIWKKKNHSRAHTMTAGTSGGKSKYFAQNTMTQQQSIELCTRRRLRHKARPARVVASPECLARRSEAGGEQVQEHVQVVAPYT